MISAKEEPESPLPPAVNGLLKVHKRLVDGMENDPSHPAPGLGSKLSTKLLVPAAQAGSLIGKQGTTVKSIQEESNCIVRVLGTGFHLAVLSITCLKFGDLNCTCELVLCLVLILLSFYVYICQPVR